MKAMEGGRVRKASNVRRPSVKLLFSVNAASSRPWSLKPFIGTDEASQSAMHNEIGRESRMLRDQHQ